MRRPVAVALLALAVAAPSAPAQASPASVVAGVTCSWHSTADPTREAGWQIGVVSGGPIAANGPVRFTCGYYVNGAAVMTIATSDIAGTGVAMLAPGLVSMPGSGTPVQYCTRVDVGGTTYHYDDATGTLTTGAFTCPTAVRRNTCVAGVCETTWEGDPAVAKA